MGIFKFAADFVGDVGFGVIKKSSRIVWGGGQAVLGMVSQDEELVEKGLKNAGQGAVGLAYTLLLKNQNGDDSETDGEDIDVDV
ncbi:MAG: hypothetical protein HC836_49605 [Richelia sp. RM2_1_2]|nr:hypothetical protein [Calothrix sp. SM1_7_51]NJO65850.1 hypothetical protein [Richelia sp. RM2_1_2]